MSPSHSPWLVGLVTVVLLAVTGGSRTIEAADPDSTRLQATLPWATEVTVVELNAVQANVYVTADAADWVELGLRCRETLEALQEISWDRVGDVYMRNGGGELRQCRAGSTLTPEEQAHVREERQSRLPRTRCFAAMVSGREVSRMTFPGMPDNIGVWPRAEPPEDEAPDRRALRAELAWATSVSFVDDRPRGGASLFVRVEDDEPPEALEKLCADVLAAIEKTGGRERGNVYVRSGNCSRICRAALKTWCSPHRFVSKFPPPPKYERPDQRALHEALPWPNTVRLFTEKDSPIINVVVTTQRARREELEQRCADVLAAIQSTGWAHPGGVYVRDGVQCIRVCRGEHLPAIGTVSSR